jgi:hypothetical protein
MSANLAIDYGSLMRDALRGVLRGALTQVANEGLSEPHHFVIAFQTAAPGVELPADLRRTYPEVMTIVLQHRFAQLEVRRDGFEVTLWFAGQPKRLVVPFAAVVAWSDPGAGVTLQIGQLGELADEESADELPDQVAPDQVPPALGSPAPDANDQDTSGKVVRFARPSRRRPSGPTERPPDDGD